MSCASSSAAVIGSGHSILLSIFSRGLLKNRFRRATTLSIASLSDIDTSCFEEFSSSFAVGSFIETSSMLRPQALFKKPEDSLSVPYVFILH